MINLTYQFLLSLKEASFQHYKGGQYKLILITRDTEVQRMRVVYRSADPKHLHEPPWDKPMAEFLDVITWPDGVQRTRYVLLTEE